MVWPNPALMLWETADRVLYSSLEKKRGNMKFIPKKKHIVIWKGENR